MWTTCTCSLGDWGWVELSSTNIHLEQSSWQERSNLAHAQILHSLGSKERIWAPSMWRQAPRPACEPWCSLLPRLCISTTCKVPAHLEIEVEWSFQVLAFTSVTWQTRAGSLPAVLTNYWIFHSRAGLVLLSRSRSPDLHCSTSVTSLGQLHHTSHII